MVFRVILIIFATFLIIRCSSNDNPVVADGDPGRLIVYLSDSPASYDSVVVRISRVEVHVSGTDTTSGSWFVINDSLRNFDLLELRNGASAVLGDTSLPPGNYTQIRLIVADSSYVVDNDGPHLLTIPSGYQTGIKLNHSFNIESDNIYELLLDFNVEKSIVTTGNGQHKLQPVIRVVPVVISGSISGQVLPLEALPGSVSAIAGTDTVTTTYIDDEGYFKLVGLLEGLYDVSILPDTTVYKASTITNVQVMQNMDNDLGTITLDPK